MPLWLRNTKKIQAVKKIRLRILRYAYILFWRDLLILLSIYPFQRARFTRDFTRVLQTKVKFIRRRARMAFKRTFLQCSKAYAERAKPLRAVRRQTQNACKIAIISRPQNTFAVNVVPSGFIFTQSKKLIPKVTGCFRSIRV